MDGVTRIPTEGLQVQSDLRSFFFFSFFGFGVLSQAFYTLWEKRQLATPFSDLGNLVPKGRESDLPSLGMSVSSFKEYSDIVIDNPSRATWTPYEWVSQRCQRREMQKSARVTHLCQRCSPLSCNLPCPQHPPTHICMCVYTTHTYIPSIVYSFG